MMTYYEVVRTRTAKPVGNNIDWSTWDRDRATFPTIQEAKKYLKDEYGKCKKTRIYKDGDNGEAVHVGYIYSYNTPPCTYGDCHHNNQDWVEVREIKSTIVII